MGRDENVRYDRFGGDRELDLCGNIESDWLNLDTLLGRAGMGSIAVGLVVQKRCILSRFDLSDDRFLAV